MKVGYDISQTYSNPAGCGYYANIFYKNLIKNKNLNIIGLKSFGPDFFDLQFNLMPISSGETIFSHHTFKECKIFWDTSDFSKKKYFNLSSPDIIHSNNFYAPPTRKFCKNIFTLYDLSFFQNPQWTSHANWHICSKGVFNASSTADHIVTISNFSKKIFLSLFPNYDEKKISIIYPSSRFENYELPDNFIFKKHSLIKKGFFLSVGTLEPRKNHLSIVKSYHKFLKKCKSNPPLLVFAGGEGWLFSDTIKYINENNLNRNIIFTGYVTDDELFWLYKNCLINIYLSHYEGFGMPILEALSAKTYSVVSDIEPFKELFGDSIITVNKNKKDFLVDLFNQIHLNNSFLGKINFSIDKVVSKFNSDHNYNKLVNLYFNI